MLQRNRRRVGARKVFVVIIDPVSDKLLGYFGGHFELFVDGDVRVGKVVEEDGQDDVEQEEAV